MADDEAVLVDYEELPDLSYHPRGELLSFPPGDEHATFGVNSSFLQATGGNSSEQEPTVPDLIIAVYVVQFDTRRGKGILLGFFAVRNFL